MESKSNRFLKVAGILMIIGGSISTIFGIIAVIGVGALAILVGSEANLGLLTLGAVLILVSAVVSLVAGIVGVKNASKPEKAKICIIFGILTVALSVLGNIFNVVGGTEFSVSGLVTGLALPVIYLVGAYQNMKLAG